MNCYACGGVEKTATTLAGGRIVTVDCSVCIGGEAVVPIAYDRSGTPGLACLYCNSAWPANEPAADYHHAVGCREIGGAA